MARIALTGATGFLGSRVCTALLERGDRLIVLARDPARAARAVPDADRVLLWAPGVPGEWRSAVADADAVIHLAGEGIGERRWTEAYKQRIFDSRVRGTREIADAVANAPRPPATLISVSGIGYYGDSGDDPVAEKAPAGFDFLARLCAAWEDGALRAASARTRVAIPRLGLVLSADSGALPRLAHPMRLFVGGPIGGGRQWFPWIHVDDAIAVLLHALDHPALSGPFNAVAPGTVRNREFMAALGRALHRPSWLRVPGVALRIAVGEFSAALLGGQRATPDALLESGFTFLYPDVDSALAQLYRW